MPLISCPACNNQCSPLASSCPQCGHPFAKKEIVSTIQEDKTDNSRKWKLLTIVAGIVAGGIITFAVYTAYFNQSQNSTNEQLTVKNNQQPDSRNTQNSSAPSPASTVAPTPIPKGNLNLEAGLIYTYDGAQPVSRTEFYLLDTDLNTVLQQAGIKSEKKYEIVRNPITRLGFAYKYPDQDPTVLPKAMQGIKSHAKYNVTTDFNGKAQFKDVIPNTYFLYGITSTRKAFAIWNLKVTVKSGENSVVLDTNNAEIAL